MVRFFLVVCSAFALLSACGFQPIHAKRNASDPLSGSLVLLENIELRAPNTLEGNRLKAELSDLLNPQGNVVTKDYVLTMDIQTVEQDLVILSDATASRRQVVLTSPYILTRIADSEPLSSGSISYTGSYAAQDNSNYAAFTVQRDIETRALTELAERYKLRLAGLFAEFSLPAEMRQKDEALKTDADRLRERDADLPTRGALPEVIAQ